MDDMPEQQGSRNPAALSVCRQKILAGPVQHNATYVELAHFLSAVFPFQFNINGGFLWKNKFDINKSAISFGEEYPSGWQPASPTPL
ncbi:MAG: hypothetical protein HFF15_05990 [Angelakisella sp.]|jgi:hypothetical protein|nr:hypothetical protein [Angelakisella sp.]